MKVDKRFLSGLDLVSPDLGLRSKIVGRIEARIRRAALVRAWIYRGVGLASVVAMYPSVSLLYSEAASSGFFGYLSLLLTDGLDVITGFGSGLALALLESLPIFGLTISLGLIGVMFVAWSKAFEVREQKLSF